MVIKVVLEAAVVEDSWPGEAVSKVPAQTRYTATFDGSNHLS